MTRFSSTKGALGTFRRAQRVPGCGAGGAGPLLILVFLFLFLGLFLLLLLLLFLFILLFILLLFLLLMLVLVLMFTGALSVLASRCAVLGRVGQYGIRLGRSRAAWTGRWRLSILFQDL